MNPTKTAGKRNIRDGRVKKLDKKVNLTENGFTPEEEAEIIAAAENPEIVAIAEKPGDLRKILESWMNEKK